jgi:dTDP-4-amino-4,6-dideoxygalactose transaminase
MANDAEFPRWPPADPEVAAALDAAARDGLWGQYHGPHVGGLEEELAAYFGVPHVLTCASGTLAVEAALRAVGVGAGDEVVLASYEYESNFLTIHAVGAKPVLVDVTPGSAALDPARLNEAFTPATKAVLVSHLHGTVADMPAVLAAGESRGIKVVEDAAQCPGAALGGKKAGSWGNAGVISFGGSKLLAAGRGGAVFFRDTAPCQRAKVWLSRGVQQWAAISEMQAAVVRPQLKRLDERTAQRQRAVVQIVQELADVPGITPLGFLGEPGAVGSVGRVFERRPTGPEETFSGSGGSSPAKPGSTHPTGVLGEPGASAIGVRTPVADAPGSPRDRSAFYKVGFHFDEARFGLPREEFCRLIRAEGVAFDPGFKALHLSRAPSRFLAAGSLPEATRLHNDCVILHHPILLGYEEEISRVARAVRSVYRKRTVP